MDKGYIELIKTIKQVTKQESLVSLGTMKSPDSVSVGDLPLDKEDLYISEQLINAETGNTVLKSGDTVLILKINAEKYVIVERVREL